MTDGRLVQAGMTVIELLIAVAIGAVVLAALNSVVSLGLRAEATGRQGNELVFQARFALERMVAAARATPPQRLVANTGGTTTTGYWFSPVMFCLNGSQLIETTTADAACTGGTAIAANVTAFAAQLPAAASAVDEPLATLSLTLVQSSVPKTVTLSTSVRLGGGVL
jgi:prepilin-type N-terminal cleavage/methylation domain-containing protein